MYAYDVLEMEVSLVKLWNGNGNEFGKKTLEWKWSLEFRTFYLEMEFGISNVLSGNGNRMHVAGLVFTVSFSHPGRCVSGG